MTKTFQQRLVMVGFNSYRDYLASEHWADVRRRYRASKLPQVCYVCGERRVQLHHRTYKNLGHERLWDLLPLCDEHHKATHVLLRTRKAQGDTRTNLWTVARRVKRQYQRKGKR